MSLCLSIYVSNLSEYSSSVCLTLCTEPVLDPEPSPRQNYYLCEIFSFTWPRSCALPVRPAVKR